MYSSTYRGLQKESVYRAFGTWLIFVNVQVQISYAVRSRSGPRTYADKPKTDAHDSSQSGTLRGARCKAGGTIAWVNIEIVKKFLDFAAILFIRSVIRTSS